MTKAAYGSLLAVALVVGLALRLASLDARPMHHDEANQAVKFGQLLESGDYRYDATDHHGPTLYYLTLPMAWARGQATLASLDEYTVRLVPVAFGMGLILLIGLTAGGVGRTASAAGALLAAVSPALTYFSRFYIQESLFVVFSLAFVMALGRYARRPGAVSAAAAGAFAGLAYATKETFVIVAGGALLALAIARMWTAKTEAAPATSVPRVKRRAQLLLLVAIALLVSFVFFSSFFRYPSGLVESFLAFGTYIGRGVGPGTHAQPWSYYLGLLSYSASGGLVWTEGLVLVLAIAGLVSAAREAAGFWPRYIALYAVITTVAFSAVRYKTPWNLLPFYSALILVAGYGAAALAEAARSRFARSVLAVVLVAGACHLAAQSWSASVRYGADPRNPYAYVHTSSDFMRLVQRVNDLSQVDPSRSGMLIKLLAGPYEQWPLPWYLRRMTRVGYWARASETDLPGGAPVLIASQENAPALDAVLGERYVAEMYGLRPGVFLTLYVERTLWDRFLASRTAVVAP